MKCEEAEELIWLYDELSPDEKKRIDDHVLNCVSCTQARTRYLQLKAATEVLRSDMPTPAHAARLTHNIMAAVGKQKVGRTSFWFAINTRAVRLACMSLSCILIIGFVIEQRQASPASVEHLTTVRMKEHHVTLNTLAFQQAYLKRLSDANTTSAGLKSDQLAVLENVAVTEGVLYISSLTREQRSERNSALSLAACIQNNNCPILSQLKKRHANF